MYEHILQNQFGYDKELEIRIGSVEEQLEELVGVTHVEPDIIRPIGHYKTQLLLN